MNYRFSSKHSFKFQLNGWQGVLVSYLVFLFISIIFSIIAFSSMAKGEISTAKTFLMIARPMTEVTSLITFKKVPIVEFWSESVVTGQELISLLDKSDEGLNGLLSSEHDKSELLSHISLMTEHGDDSWILRTITKKKGIDFKDLENLAGIAELIEKERAVGKKYLLLFQNSDEIRATGGFIGSYAVLDLSSDNLLEFNIRDIYDPSGVSKRRPSPVGHSKYLSGGGEMALHDANWNPEFSKSATDILWFFENIDLDPQFYDGVIAINFSSIEKVVSLLGEIYLPDEGEFVEASELSNILRSDRSEFFAGSKQKTQQLLALRTALTLKLNSLSKEEKSDFAKDFLASKVWQEVQFFSKDEVIQKGWRDLNLSGDLYSYTEDELYIFPVESNVGVNKANKWVSRFLDIENNEELIRLKTTFVNQATINDRPVVNSTNQDYESAIHLSYVNYYRFITSPNLKLISVKSGNEVLSEWNYERVIGSNGQEYAQYGFLVVVPESSQTEVVLDFSTDVEGDVVFQKQAGLVYENKPGDRFLIEDVQ